MPIYVAPKVAFEASVSGAPSGLVGTMGVRIVDVPTATTVLARTTAGIVEYPAGSGVYTTILTAPGTPGTYQVVWDSGVVSPTTSAEEDLFVSALYPGEAVASGSDLCTLDQVRAWLGKPPADTAQNDVIQDVITRASRAIMRFADREFVARAANPATRVFVVEGAWRSRVLRVGDLAAAPTAVVVRTSTGSTVSTLNVASDIEVGPLVRWGWEPITELRFVGGATLDGTHRVAVTGTWGWPSIPEDVQQAAIITAGHWVRRYVQSGGSALSPEAVDETGVVESIPPAARALVVPYRMPVLA